MRSGLYFVIFASLIFLCACVKTMKQPETYEEMQFRQSSEKCQKEATSIHPEQPYNMNQGWKSAYSMCMIKFGYTEEMQFRDASWLCEMEANGLHRENPYSINPEWKEDYNKCMYRFGYTDEEINTPLY